MHVVIELELKAGIAGAADRARNGVFLWNVDSDVPFGSRASVQEARDVRRLEHEATMRRTRSIYFSVTDLDISRSLIAAHRGMDTERHRAAHATVAAARVGLNVAVRNGGALPVSEVIGAVLSAGFVWAVQYWAGTGIALGLLAALTAFLPSSIVALLARRDAAIRAAEQELRLAEENAEEAYALGPAFTASEERSGEPDPRTT